jgi:oligopeptide/dipeptide ABC transporter ATP-binding protein
MSGPHTNGDGAVASGRNGADGGEPSGEVVLETSQICKTYAAPGGGIVRALVDVDVKVVRGRTLGLVGESGSGKTTLTRMLLALEQPSSGAVVFEGDPLTGFGRPEMQQYRHSVAAVFQNPYSSLDPRMRIWDAITEQQAIEKSASKEDRRKRAEELLELVGLGAAMAERYPHQLSGGQRQRVAIARAMATNPEVIVLDEPLSALDVSVSAQIVNLLLDLQERMGVTFVFVGHDLRLVRHLCHDVAVMYRGRVVEQGAAMTLLDAPAHPYTKALVTASNLETLADSDDADTKALAPDDGIGCPYRTRCGLRDERCDTEAPQPVAFGRRVIRCHHPIADLAASGSRAGSPDGGS